MNPLTLPTRFTIIDDFSPKVKGMGASVHDLASKLAAGIGRSERLFRKLTPAFSAAQKQLLNYVGTGAIIGGVATGIGFTAKSMADYETSVQSLSAVTGVTGKQLTNFKGEIKSLADESKKSAIDVAASFEVVGSMMSQYLEDPKALRDITKAGIVLAKASRQELTPTLENLTSVMNQFELGAGKAMETVNRLTAGEIVGSLRTSQVTDAIKEFGAGAFAANISLSESVALVEALAKQLKTDKIGVGARNILTVMDSSTGLAKKARKELKHAGVDLKFLMDKSKSLSERLHELSKVQGNAKAITKIFGHENKTAAQVIFNQLATYDDYVAKIQTTNAAQVQAITNSETLASAIDQLKNTWINYTVTGDKAAEGLNKAKDAIHFLTTNMDQIVNTGLKVIQFYVEWKAVMLASTVVMGAYNIAIGIQGALSKTVAINVGKSTVALRAYKITTALAAKETWSLSAAWAANPVGLVITGITVLASAVAYLAYNTSELNEENARANSMNTLAHIDAQADAASQLAEKWKAVGLNIHDATVKALEFQSNAAIKNLQGVTDKKKSAEQGVNEAFDNALFPAFSPSVTRALNDLEKINHEYSAALADMRGTTDAIIRNINGGVISVAEANAILKGTPVAQTGQYKNMPAAVQGTSPIAPPEEVQQMNKTITSQVVTSSAAVDYTKMKAAFGSAMNENPQKITIELKGAPSGTTVSSANNTVTTPNSY